MSLSANYLASYFLPSFNKRNYVKKEFGTIVTASSLPRKGIFKKTCKRLLGLYICHYILPIRLKTGNSKATLNVIRSILNIPNVSFPKDVWARITHIVHWVMRPCSLGFSAFIFRVSLQHCVPPKRRYPTCQITQPFKPRILKKNLHSFECMLENYTYVYLFLAHCPLIAGCLNQYQKLLIQLTSALCLVTLRHLILSTFFVSRSAVFFRLPSLFSCVD